MLFSNATFSHHRSEQLQIAAQTQAQIFTQTQTQKASNVQDDNTDGVRTMPAVCGREHQACSCLERGVEEGEKGRR